MVSGYKVGALARILKTPSSKKNKQLTALFDVSKNENATQNAFISPTSSITWKKQQSKEHQRKRKHSSEFPDDSCPKKVKKFQQTRLKRKNQQAHSDKKPKKMSTNVVTTEEQSLISSDKVLKKHVESPDEKLRTIYVGNLPKTYQKKALLRLFKEFGKIECVRFRSAAVPDFKTTKKVAIITGAFHPDRNNVSAYVRFKNAESVDRALLRNGHEVDGFHIKVDTVSDNKEHDYKCSVFVGNLPYNVDDDVVYRHFEQCGDMEGVRIIRDGQTGLGKGFGYVCFKHPDAVQLALHLADRRIGGREVRIKRALKMEKNVNTDTVKAKTTSWKKPANKVIRATSSEVERPYQGVTVQAKRKERKRPKKKTNKKKVFF